jgi:phytol kinase
MMDEKHFVIYILLSIFFVLFLVRFSSYLRINRKLKTAYTRKLFHVCIFSLAAFLQLKLGIASVLIFGGFVSVVVLYAVYKGDGFPFFEALARESDYPHRRAFILLPLLTTAVGGIISNVLFGHIAFVGYLVGGWGDAVGEPVGARWGKNAYKVPSLFGLPAKRSLQGSAAVFIVSCISAYIALWYVGPDINYPIFAAILCGLSACVVEAVSTHGLDNLTIQIAASAVAYAFIN